MSSASSDFIEQLKIKYKEGAFFRKLAKEKAAIQVKERELILNEQISKTKDELDFLSENILEVQRKTSEARHQVSIIEICKASEQAKIDCLINNLNQHREGFDNMFKAAIAEAEDLKKKSIDIEKKKQEMIKQKHAETKIRNDQLLKETVMVENDCDLIERECSVLKKRNAAIMLKLRRKLIETEEIRRKLLKKNTVEHNNVANLK